MNFDYGGDRYNGKSTTRYIFTLGGIIVSWVWKLQKVVLSSTVTEYALATKAIKEFIWVKQLMSKFVLRYSKCNSSC